MKTTNKKALIYCRVSTQGQKLEGGLGSQEKRCADYAKIKGYEVERVFQDSYSGGGDFMKRPAMRQLLRHVDDNPQHHYVVIFDDLKRFARDLKFHWQLRAEFQSRNLVPECLNFTFEETPEGAFIETIIAAQGELEREQNKRQVVQKMKARLERGIYCMGGFAPFGYRYEKNQLLGGKSLGVHPNEAKLVKAVFKEFALGRLYHMNDVLKYLNIQMAKTSKRKLKLDSIKSMLTNILYTGYLEYPKWNISLLKGVHEPIISMAMFQQVQERLNGKLPKRTGNDTQNDFPLRGFVSCIHCHRPFTASWSTGKLGKKHPYYRCSTKNCPQGNKSIPRKELHEQFIQLLKGLSFKQEFINIIKLNFVKEFNRHARESMSQIARNKIEQEELSNQISGLIKLITTNPNSPLVEDYEKEVKKLKISIKILDEKSEQIDILSDTNLEHLLDKACKIINHLYDKWENGDYDERIMVQKLLLNSNIEYGRKENFGTPKSCYILSFLQSFSHKNDQNFCDVDITQISWNTIIEQLQEINKAFNNTENPSNNTA
ncbi:MAG: recombinase family protein [Chitinophagales bacterium]|nr:recombinase family protein [Chitinophagales bacterium]